MVLAYESQHITEHGVTMKLIRLLVYCIFGIPGAILVWCLSACIPGTPKNAALDQEERLRQTFWVAIIILPLIMAILLIVILAPPVPQPAPAPQIAAPKPKLEVLESVGTKSWREYQVESKNLCHALRNLGGPKC